MPDFTKANANNPYRIDDRVTVNNPLEPTSHNVYDGPTLLPQSGIRVNPDINPSGLY